MQRRTASASILIFYVLCLQSQSSAIGNDSRQCYEVRNDTVCYFQPPDGLAMNWDDADKFCRDNNATLPVILNSDHQRTIEKYLTQFPKTNKLVFTAGRKSGSIDPNYQWRWVNGKQFRRPIDVSNQDTIFGCIQFDAPITHNGISSCSFYPLSFICKYPESTCKTLDKATNHIHYGRTCFVIYNDHLRWYYARNKCLEDGGDLATFDDVDSLTAFHNFTSATKAFFGYTRYFIGLQRKWWIWRVTESLDIRYTNWPTRGQHDYINDDTNDLNCLCLGGSNDFQWTSCNCLKGKSILCQSVAEDLLDENVDDRSVSDHQTDAFSNVSQCYDVSGTQVCYFTPEDSMRLTFASSNQWCTDHNATLPTIRNKADQKNLESFLRTISLPIYLLWTSGLKVKTGIWSWINGQPFPDSEADYLPRSVSFHLRTRSRETLELKGSLGFEKKTNFEYIGYICQLSGDSCKTFSNGIRTKSDHCLVLNEELMSWHKARNKCIDIGGDLATFEDVSEISELAPLMTSDKSYHIGLENTRWIWYQSVKVDDRVQYSDWNESVRDFSMAQLDVDSRCLPSQPCARDLENSNFCLCLETFTFKWTPCNCDFNFRFVCQRDEMNSSFRSSLQTKKPDSQNETCGNPGSITAIAGGLIIALLTTAIVFLAIRLRMKVQTFANAEIEMRLRMANQPIQSIPTEYQDLKIYEDLG